ncbi:MAG: MFS transporter [Eubacteriaceae bacterium]|nr:MFS transporter [Eubacteriaceae bacterium]
MSAEQIQEVEESIGKKTPWIFFFNTFAQAWGIQITNQFMNMFMTGYAMIDPLVLASIIAFGSALDSALSFVAGTIVQKANFKTGPYRTWVLLNGPLMTIGIFLIFLNPDISPSGKVVVFIIGYLFRNCPQNFLLAAQNTLIRKVAGTNMADRLAITAKGSQGSNAARIIVNFIAVYAIEFFNNMFGAETGRGYLVVGVGFVLIQTAFQIYVYRSLAPFDKYDPNLKKVEGSSVNVKVTHMYTDTFRNPQIWILMLSATVRTIATNTMTPMTTYVFRYSIMDITKLSTNNTIGSFFGLIAAFLIPPVAKKLGKKNSNVTSGLLFTIGYVFMAIFGHGNEMVLLIGTVWNAMAQALNASIGVNNYIDAAEYQLYTTGRDSRPFIMGLNAITMKVAKTIASFATAWVLTSSGYESLGGGQANINAPALVKNLYGLLAGLYLASSVIMLFFKINEAKAKEYADANKKMMEERAAAAGVEVQI